MRIVAEKVTAKELKPGDLYSTESQSYWDSLSRENVWEILFIRTETPTPVYDAERTFYRITVEREEEE